MLMTVALWQQSVSKALEIKALHIGIVYKALYYRMGMYGYDNGSEGSYLRTKLYHIGIDSPAFFFFFFFFFFFLEITRTQNPLP
ncbi:hypothetical protein V8C42DRAFT_326132, partial [Trichoderma barbatum]